MHCSTALLISCLFVFIGLPEVNSGASNSLSDCQAVASMFLTTINYTAANITATTGVNVTCSATGVVCPGTTINGVCVWQRKLSAVCRSVSGVTKIRIQTNGLPPRCASVPMGTFSELNVDFEVNFNPAVSINSLNQNLTTRSALSTLVCNLINQATPPSTSGYVQYGMTTLTTAAGVALDGVMIFNVDSADDIDPFYPPPGSNAETVDACLAHCQTAGIYHYHIASSCVLNPPTGSISSCAGTTACNGLIANYSISGFASYQTMTVLGVARDGHVVYGPYLSAGTRVTSGFDVCNGMFYDSIGNYAYFATSTYPYLTGCFGPGNYPSFGPNCSSNAVSSYTMSTYATSFLSSNSSNSTTVSTSSTTIAVNASTTTAPTASTTIASNASTTSASNNIRTSSAGPQAIRSSFVGVLVLFSIIVWIF
ncbi:unnamed protein product [Didymodactylos carnosus]|uniref:YHYH domain-containing protein n=1 Tax=Didymodactylos carnosus TaxID=1234261 RepID=A0A8S2Q442_9BILA|nr:unnamed protein product [Didymodactylos carnosus]CAF4083844.1 unnamed protein product [Didymodactylos carnosus]